MAIALDENQSKIVATKRLPASKRPKYYDSQKGTKVPITEDFEAFLILQGKTRNKEALNWLNEANGYAIADADRDALIEKALSNELTEAQIAKAELGPITDQFNRFRERFQIKGFEGVAEAGQFFADVQRPMGEIINLMSRHQHRIVFATLLKSYLLANGVSQDRQKQISSWNEPLTSY
jgi:hypothetical protein